MLLSQPAKHGPPGVGIDRAEDPLGAPRMAVEGTPSSQKPVQVAEQIVQTLANGVSSADSLDSLAQTVALLLWDQRHDPPPLEAAAVANDDVVPKEGEALGHRGDERL